MADRIILASSSPRRLDLLRSIGVEPIVHAADIDESARSGEIPEALVRRLGVAKTEKIAAEFAANSSTVVLAADTVVLLDGEVLNKPVDATDAKRMLAALSGRSHDVLSGVAVATSDRTEAEVVRSQVTLRSLTGEDIDTYVATGEPYGKAGSYAIQGYAAVFVTSIVGSYHNVVGLPLHTVESLLARLGIPLITLVGAK